MAYVACLCVPRAMVEDVLEVVEVLAHLRVGVWAWGCSRERRGDVQRDSTHRRSAGCDAGEGACGLFRRAGRRFGDDLGLCPCSTRIEGRWSYACASTPPFPLSSIPPHIHAPTPHASTPPRSSPGNVPPNPLVERRQLILDRRRPAT